MDLAALKIFLAVAHERSFSRAAAKVHRTQPAVSQAVRRLELELGEQLFDRSSKTGTLTEAGRMLQNYGQRLVRLAEETESALHDQDRFPTNGDLQEHYRHRTVTADPELVTGRPAAGVPVLLRGRRE